MVSTLKVGYREMGTASVYDNEKEVGRAVEECWVTSFVGKPKCDLELRKSLNKL